MTEVPGLKYKDVGICMVVGIGLNMVFKSKQNELDGQISPRLIYQDIEKWGDRMQAYSLLAT